jgi:hypothetical protein
MISNELVKLESVIEHTNGRHFLKISLCEIVA